MNFIAMATLILTARKRVRGIHFCAAHRCRASVPRQAVAIGQHGQTVRHHLPAGDVLYTVQIGDPNRLAERTGIDGGRRLSHRRDMAAEVRARHWYRPSMHPSWQCRYRHRSGQYWRHRQRHTHRCQRGVTEVGHGPGNTLLDSLGYRGIKGAVR